MANIGTPPSITKSYSGSRGQVFVAAGLPLANVLETYHTSPRRRMPWGRRENFDAATNAFVTSDVPLICSSFEFNSGKPFRVPVADNYLVPMRVKETSIDSYTATISEAPVLITPDTYLQSGYALINNFVTNKLGVEQMAVLDNYASRIAIKTSVYDRWLLFVLKKFHIQASGVGGLQPMNFSLELEGILPGTFPLVEQMPNRYVTTSTANYVFDDQFEVRGAALEAGGRLATIKDCVVTQGIFGAVSQVVDISLDITQNTQLASTGKPEDAGFLPRHADHMFVTGRSVTGSLTFLSASAVGADSGPNEGQGVLSLTMGPFTFVMPSAFITSTSYTLSTGTPVTRANFIAKGVSIIQSGGGLAYGTLCREFW